MAEEHNPLSPSALPDPPATLPPPADGAPAGAITPFENGAPALATTAAPGIPEVSAPKPARKESAAPEPKDVVREIAETIVFVIVLVLLLKTFIAEAFVIPTGSMATTLWGYQKYVTCEQCQYQFPVNCSSQVDPQEGQATNVMSCTCPNCMHKMDFASKDDPPWNSGDRVLVFKSWFDSGLGEPHRLDVVVFKYPENPQKDNVAMNYIKRLVGLGGETIAIHQGNLYVTRSLDYKWREPDRPEREEERWTRHWRFVDDERAMKVLNESLTNPNLADGFKIIRKAPIKILAMARIVNDNDFQAPGQPPRWEAQAAWLVDNAKMPRRLSHGAGQKEPDWLRYRHLLRGHDTPQPIKDFMGYNTNFPKPTAGENGVNFVSDLMLECQAEVEAAAGGLWLELSKGPDRFQARFDLASGDCALVRVQKRDGQVVETELSKASTTVQQPGKYHIRLANFDDRLTLWVDDALPFGDGVAYDPPRDRWPDHPTENDLEPASIAAPGAAVSVSALKLWRDTYYTNMPSGTTFFVQPGHFLCLGDNSPESSDGRYWGLVPERLMLGRALMVYFPFKFPYPPLNLPANRVGPIH